MISIRLKEILRSKGITSITFAKGVGVSATTVSYWINGHIFPPADMLEKISSYLDVPVWQLFVSPEEVASYVNAPNALRCPHCGGLIEVVTETTLKPL